MFLIAPAFALLLLPAFAFAFDSQPTPGTPLEFDWQRTIAEKSKKDIEDYFYLLPSDFLDCEGAQFGFYNTEKKRKQLITLIDLKNGYLTFFKTSQITVFKDRVNQRDIIAVQSGRCGAGNTCGAVNALYELKQDKWSKNDALFPEKVDLTSLYYNDEVCPYFDLPRHGLTLKVMNEFNGEVYRQYKWNRQAFERIGTTENARRK